MYYGKDNNRDNTQGTNQFECLGDTELVDYFEENTWIDSDLLDPTPPSELANKSNNSQYLGITDICKCFWKLLHMICG